jgi:hypothetical protein
MQSEVSTYNTYAILPDLKSSSATCRYIACTLQRIILAVPPSLSMAPLSDPSGSSSMLHTMSKEALAWKSQASRAEELEEDGRHGLLTLDRR